MKLNKVIAIPAIALAAGATALACSACGTTTAPPVIARPLPVITHTVTPAPTHTVIVTPAPTHTTYVQAPAAPARLHLRHR